MIILYVIDNEMSFKNYKRGRIMMNLYTTSLVRKFLEEDRDKLSNLLKKMSFYLTYCNHHCGYGIGDFKPDTDLGNSILGVHEEKIAWPCDVLRVAENFPAPQAYINNNNIKTYGTPWKTTDNRSFEYLKEYGLEVCIYR